MESHDHTRRERKWNVKEEEVYGIFFLSMSNTNLIELKAINHSRCWDNYYNSFQNYPHLMKEPHLVADSSTDLQLKKHFLMFISC